MVTADASEPQKDARVQAVTNMQPYLNSLFGYHVTNSEVENVQVDTGVLAVGPPIVTPTDGGATLFTGTITADLNGKTLSQNNKGTIK